MNQPCFAARYVLVQGLEKGEFLQMRIETRHRHLSVHSFRFLAFPCLVSLALVELWALTCGCAFSFRFSSLKSLKFEGEAYIAHLCVGWVLKEKDVEAWMDAHGVHSSQIGEDFQAILDAEERELGWPVEPWEKGDGPRLGWSEGSYDWVGDDGGDNRLPPDWHVCRIEDANSGETTWILNWYRSPYVEIGCDEFGFESLNATDLTALLADTDSLARGAALAAEMGNTGLLKAFAVPALYSAH